MPHAKGFGGRRRERSDRAAPIGEVVAELMRERVFARGGPIGKLAADWAAVVGPRLAAESAPVSLERGLLVVAAASGPWGAQVRFLDRQILERANAALGETAVAHVRVVVRETPRTPWGARPSGAPSDDGSASGTAPDVTPD